MKHKIEFASVYDIEQVRDLLVQSNRTREEYKDVGFLELEVPSIEEYKDAVEQKQTLLVARDKENKVIGYVFGYNSKYFLQNIAQKSEIEQTIANKAKIPFFYIEQLAVDTQYRGKGLGTQLLQAIIYEGLKQGQQEFWSVTAHAPKNKAVVSMFNDFNFEMVGEVEISSGLVFGIYFLDTTKNKTFNSGATSRD